MFLGLKPDECPLCLREGMKVKGKKIRTRLFRMHYYIDYECLKGHKYTWRKKFRTPKKIESMSCEHCLHKGLKPTSRLTNETERIAKIEVMCPQCNHKYWIKIETETDYTSVLRE